QHLEVRVAGDVADAAKAGGDHAIDGVGSAAADPDHFDDGGRGLIGLELDGEPALLVGNEFDHGLTLQTSAAGARFASSGREFPTRGPFPPGTLTRQTFFTGTQKSSRNIFENDAVIFVTPRGRRRDVL